MSKESVTYPTSLAFHHCLCHTDSSSFLISFCGAAGCIAMLEEPPPSESAVAMSEVTCGRVVYKSINIYMNARTIRTVIGFEVVVDQCIC